ncbi:MAG: transglutaminase domain-containing protein [Vagococcus sp.]|uniref:transglutaminase domain-containing protein n=1 Tax=Vagococcus sp. TaxID=1933889 RepID=UPI002FCA3391
MNTRHKKTSQPASLKMTEATSKHISPLKLILSFISLFLISISFYLFLSQFSMTLRKNMMLSSLFILGWLVISVILTIKFKEDRKKVLFIYSVSFLVLYILTFYWTKDGSIQLFNESIAQVGRFKGHYYMALNRGNQLNFTLLCLILTQGLVLLALIIEQFFFSGIIITWLILVGSGSFLLKSFNVYVFICLSLATFLLMLFRQNNSKAHSLKQIVQPLMISVILILLTLVPIYLLKINELTVTSKKIETLQENTKEKIETKKYGKDLFLPMGQLNNYKENRTDIEVLTIEMTKKEPLYLKQYIGKTIKDDSWESLSNDSLYNDFSLNYWLDKGEFSSFTQLSDLSVATNKQNTHTTVTINNMASSRKQLFIPYGMIKTSDLNGKLTNDSFIKSFSDDEKSYSFEVMEKATVIYPNLVKQYADLKNKNSANEYLLNESNYNHFVYKNYLDVPEGLTSQLTNVTKVNPKLAEHVYYEKADAVVANFIESIYQEPSVKSSIPNNFIERSLSKKHKVSFDTEVATLSTLMYRHMGIPARYVEGYLVTPDLIANSTEKVMSVTGKAAHAWVEIYQDGVGWVPKETDPSYVKIMPQPTFEGLSYKGNNEKEGKGESENNEKNAEELVDNANPETKKTKEKEKKSFKQYVVTALIILVILAVLLGFISILIKLSKAYKQRQIIKQRMGNSDSLKASQEKLLEIYRLLHLDNIDRAGGSLYDYVPLISKQYKDKKYTQLYEKVIRDIQHATYSNEQELSKRQLERIDKLLLSTQYHVFNETTFKEKIHMKYRLFFS